MADFMTNAGSFVANPFGFGDAGYGFLDQLSNQLGLSNKAQVQQGIESLDQLIGDANKAAAQNRGLYNQYLEQMQGMYGPNAAQYNQSLQNYQNAIGNGYDTFEYGGNVNEFYDKFANQRAQQAMNAMRNAGGANLFGSDYMNNMAAKQQALASEEASKAYDKMMQDRQQQLAEWQAGQQNKQSYISNLGNITNLFGNDRSQLANAYGDYYSNMASQNNADLQTKSDLAQAKTNLTMQENNGIGGLLGAAGSVLGAIFG